MTAIVSTMEERCKLGKIAIALAFSQMFPITESPDPL
jgi:hypothetical protein